jgi:uncharacterized protein (TIGR02271 family)
MSTLEDVQTWRGRTVVDPDGDKIGSIEDVYLDRQSGEAEWIVVKTGLLGTRVSFVPIRDARLDGDDVRVGYDKDKVKDAPNVESDGELSPEEERALYEYYGRSDYGEWTEESEDRTLGVLGADPRDEQRFGRTGTAGETETGTTAEGTRAAEGGRAGAGDEEAMTRSEEELRVGTEARDRGRARLRKYVVTEQETKTVPLRREEARVEREPITEANVAQATSGPEISEAEHEVTLHEEEPVVEKRVEPKERVRLEKDVQTEEETVSDEVRKERIEPEGDIGGDRP